MEFTKMHGLGNDYVYVDCFASGEDKIADPASLARAVSRRHWAIGADGLVLICPSTRADVRMRMFNADGSEAEMCGNAIRCVAKYAIEHKLCQPGGAFSVPGGKTFGASLRIETLKAVLTVGCVIDENQKVQQVCVNMGEPVLRPADIPVLLCGDAVIAEPIELEGAVAGAGPGKMTCVSMGNPHAVFFCDDLSVVKLERIGPLIENHRLFPRRVNVHFVKVESEASFSMQTWERGSGITLACGTGACACCVAGVLNGRCGRAVTAHLPGGDLELFWSASDGCVYMTGPCQEVFSGTWPD